MSEDLRAEYDFTDAVKNPHLPAVADSEAQKALLWKKIPFKEKILCKGTDAAFRVPAK